MHLEQDHTGTSYFKVRKMKTDSKTLIVPYLPEMIESFGVPKDQVSKWAGIASAVYSLSQGLTGIAWGWASDRFGRKPAVLAAMTCIMASSLLFGFSRNLVWAIVARSLGGASNGNVGIIRTMVAEMVPYKELQPRAFSIMPLVWLIGSIFGPSFGGALANPAQRYPRVFGDNSFFKAYPFALPNLVGAMFFLVGLSTGALFLRETLETKKDRQDYGILLGEILLRPFTRRKKQRPTLSLEQDQSAPLLGHNHDSGVASHPKENRTAVPISTSPTYREVFSRQSSLNLLSYSLLVLHCLAYDQLLPVFMHYPQQTDRSTNPDVRLPFKFTGGFGLNSDRIGLLFTADGVVGVFIQILISPPLIRHYGVLPCLKFVTTIFPVACVITPFTALLPTSTAQQVGVLVVMIIKCVASAFAFPCSVILLSTSAVSPRILGTLNGMAVSLSAVGRAAGPAIGGFTFTVGVEKGYGILPWWVLACFAILGAIVPWWLVEMEGFGEGKDVGDNNGNGQDEELREDDDEEERRSSATLIDNGPLAENGDGMAANASFGSQRRLGDSEST